MRKIFLFGLLILCTSCVKNLDFDQIEDLGITPTLEFAALFSEFKEKDFIDEDTGAELVSFSDEGDFTILNEDFTKKNITSIVIKYELVNEIDRNFRIDFSFLDANRNEVYQMDSGTVNAGNLAYKNQTTININPDASILNTRKLRFTFSIGNGAPLDFTSEKAIKLKTAIAITYKID